MPYVYIYIYISLYISSILVLVNVLSPPRSAASARSRRAPGATSRGPGARGPPASRGPAPGRYVLSYLCYSYHFVLVLVLFMCLFVWLSTCCCLFSSWKILHAAVECFRASGNFAAMPAALAGRENWTHVVVVFWAVKTQRFSTLPKFLPMFFRLGDMLPSQRPSSGLRR